MNGLTTALSVPGTTTLRLDDPVVVLGTDVPSWLRGWCRRAGRELDDRRGAPIEPDTPPFTAQLASDVTGLAGRTTFVARHAPAHPGPPRVVAAIRDLPDDARVLVEAAGVAAHRRATLVITHAVPISYAERSVGLDDALEHARLLLAAAAESVAERLAPECPVVSSLIRARPYELVGERLYADLLVMGGPRGHRGDGLGLVVNSALYHAPCPILLAPRAP